MFDIADWHSQVMMIGLLVEVKRFSQGEACLRQAIANAGTSQFLDDLVRLSE